MGMSNISDSSSDSQQLCLQSPLLLQHLLEHIDVRQRVRSCALVCRFWHLVAIAASHSISFTTDSQSKVTALAAWLHSHGMEVQRLLLHKLVPVPPRLQLQLPCQQLTQLEELSLWRVNLHQSSFTNGRTSSSRGCASTNSTTSSSSAGTHQPSLADLSRLTSLQLRNCSADWHLCLKQLPSLTRLRSLHLYCVDPTADSNACTLAAAVATALPQLLQLTYLALGADAGSCRQSLITDAAISNISCLRRLQQLQLLSLTTSSAASLTDLPPSLTSVRLVACTGTCISSSTTSAMAQLTGLRQLTLEDISELEPSFLSCLLQLQQLNLTNCTYRPRGSAGTVALLAAVSHMTGLESLALNSYSSSQAPAEAYAALTVSSNLTNLRLGGLLPPAALKYMFAAGRQLPNLHTLSLATQFHAQTSSSRDQEHQQLLVRLQEEEAAAAAAAARLQDSLAAWQAGIRGLWSCSSSLKIFELYWDLDGDHKRYAGPHAELDGLLRVCTGLTRLVLRNAAISEQTLLGTVAQLTGLVNLSCKAYGLTYMGLLRLTSLRQLRGLYMDVSLAKLVLKAGWWHSTKQTVLTSASKTPPGSPPDVWHQLQDICVANSSKCAKLVEQQQQQQQESDRSMIQGITSGMAKAAIT